MPGDLGTITTKQKITGNALVTRDANNNQVALPSGDPIPAFDQQGIVEVQNLVSDPNATPAHSRFTFDVLALGTPSNGPMTIQMQTHQANGNAGFIDPVTITVTLDPSTPGPATHFDVTPGTVSSL